MTGKKAWGLILAFSIAHEVTCKDDELLSVAVDRALEKHPVLVYLGFILTVAHLLNWLPQRIDPYTHAGAVYARVKKGNQ